MSTVLNLIDLRAGTTADLAAVEALMADAFDPRFGEAWTRGQCLGIMALPGVWLTVASIDGTPAGFTLSRIILDEAELLLLATAPSCRRRGVGATLLRATIADARDRGAVTLHLEVRDGNDAVRLYSKAGFAKVGQRRGYYRGTNGQVSDAFTYRCALA
ncbi:GNAT family N-acetyltransferase [Sphingomonas sp. PB4P5]|uniref:GNAT family N-acetyltransferase n=1 Tax=Parasphingomonas puruogangriensis TaxID=3096155 RepID=UPI002FCAE09B